MKRMLSVLPLVSLLWVAAPAKADFSWGFPYGEIAIVWALGSVGHSFIFIDYVDDIFLLNTTHSSTPRTGNLGFGAAYAYYLANRGYYYDVYIDQGGGFFWVSSI